MKNMFLLDILLERGFKLYQGGYTSFSTMQKDGIDARFKKDNIVFIWGLHEKGKPPTLISPRPKIIKLGRKPFENWMGRWGIKPDKNGTVSDNKNESHDDMMNECLNIFPHETIIDVAINKNATFDLNKKEIIYD